LAVSGERYQIAVVLMEAPMEPRGPEAWGSVVSRVRERPMVPELFYPRASLQPMLWLPVEPTFATEPLRCEELLEQDAQVPV